MTDAFLGAAQFAYELGLTEDVSILTAATTRDALNQPVTDWSNPVVVTTVKGDVRKPSPQNQRLIDDEQVNGTGYEIAVPVGSPVSSLTRLRINGVTFTVIDAFTEETTVSHLTVLAYVPRVN